MRAFILSLIKQVMNEAVTKTQGSQGLEMPGHSSDHSWHPGDSLQIDASIEPLQIRHFIFVKSAHKIKEGS